MADTSQARIYYAEESTWGTAESGTFIESRITGESLSESKDTVVSDELRSDRQITDVKPTQIRADGSIDVELSFATFDDWYEGVLLNTWGTDISVSPTSVDVIDAETFQGSADDFEDFSEGQWINVGGMADSDNNGYFRISSINGDSSEVTVEYATLTNTTGETPTFEGEMIRNGTTDKFFTFEKELSDVGHYFTYPGTYFSTMDHSFDTGSLATGTFDIMAKQEVSNESQSASDVTSANGNPIINTTEDITEIRENGSDSVTVSSLSFSYDNNLRERPALGSKTTQEFGTGRVAVTGTLEAYFESSDVYERYLDSNYSDVSFRVEDSDSNAYIFTMGRMRYTDGSVEVSGPNEDVFASLDFQAIRIDSDTVGDKTFQIDRFPSS